MGRVREPDLGPSLGILHNAEMARERGLWGEGPPHQITDGLAIVTDVSRGKCQAVLSGLALGRLGPNPLSGAPNGM